MSLGKRARRGLFASGLKVAWHLGCALQRALPSQVFPPLVPT